MACANTGAAPSVEIPITKGERSTTEPNEKSQNFGRSITLTSAPAARAAARKRRASSSSRASSSAITAPSKSPGAHARR